MHHRPTTVAWISRPASVAPAWQPKMFCSATISVDVQAPLKCLKDDQLCHHSSTHVVRLATCDTPTHRRWWCDTANQFRTTQAAFRTCSTLNLTESRGRRTGSWVRPCRSSAGKGRALAGLVEGVSSRIPNSSELHQRIVKYLQFSNTATRILTSVDFA